MAPLSKLKLFLLYQTYMSYVRVFFTEEVVDHTFPDIYIFLSYFGTSISFSIPTFAPSLGIEDVVAPAVEDPHFELVGIDAFTQGEEQVVDAVTVRREGIGGIEGEVGHYPHAIGYRVCAAVLSGHYLLNTIQTGIGVGMAGIGLGGVIELIPGVTKIPEVG
jgi:hypothetical protein